MTYVRDADVLGERAAAAAEDLVPRPELGDVLAHRPHLLCHVSTKALGPGPGQPGRRADTYGVPLMKCQSSGLTDAARTRTSPLPETSW